MNVLTWLTSSRYRRYRAAIAERRRRNADRVTRLAKRFMDDLERQYVNAGDYREARIILGMMMQARNQLAARGIFF